MTKFAVVAVLLLVNAAFGANVFLGNKNKITVGAFAQLQKIEQSKFGKDLLDTIALQVKNQAPLTEIARLLAELKSDLEHQQGNDDQLHAEREQQCADEIAAYNARIAHASSEIQEATSRIGALENRIGELHSSIASYESHISNTEDAIATAISTRAERAAQFGSRTTQHNGVLDALDIILSKLTSVGAQGGDIEAGLLQLAKIGSKNPIAAFVQVAASLDPSAWENVRSKLQALRDSTAASLADDYAHEVAEIQAHSDLLDQLNALLSSLRSGLAQDQQELSEQQADLAQQRIRLSTNQSELQNATEGLAAKEQQCQDWRDQYARDTQQRNNEIAIIVQVQDIFARKLDTATGYLRDRMEADN